jgi:hypothetical protein
VLPIGDPSAGGLAHEQLDARLATLPTIGHVPRLGGAAGIDTFADRALDAAFEPIVRWILDARATRKAVHRDEMPTPDTMEHHVANRLYREVVDP